MKEDRPGATFWVMAAAGWAVVLAGVRGIVEVSIDTRPADLARFVAGGILLHDLVVAPLVVLAGVAVARLVPGPIRPAIQGALVASAIIALFAFPLVRGYGRAANNPTSLPHDYAANLAAVLAAVWAVAAVAAVVRVRHRRQRAE